MGKSRVVNVCACTLLLASVGMSDSRSAAAPASRPNIIVVLADDMGFSDLGCYGGEIKTPTIDGLAKEGIRFSQFYNCAICGPSRASLMTGCYPWNVGQKPGADIFANLTKNCTTIFEQLKEAGYETCAVGRLDMVVGDDWHNPEHIARHVDRSLGSASGGPGNYYREVGGTPWFRDGKRWDRPAGAYSTDLISDFVAKFIEGTAGSDQPFFIYVSHYAPHWPLQADEEHIAPYRAIYEKTGRAKLMQARLDRLIEDGLIPRGTTLHQSALNATSPHDSTPFSERAAIHAAMVASIDRSVADMMAALKKADKLENTLVLVLSDNGASHQIYADRVPTGARVGSVETFVCQGSALAALNNTPFRDYKTSDYEGGIASPLVAWWPKGLKDKGRITHRLSHIADIMPTCLELAGAAYPATFRERTVIPLAGKSFVNVLHGNPPNGDANRVIAFPAALRDGEWKLMLGKSPELYNLREDRNETKNLAAKYPERVKTMQQMHVPLVDGSRRALPSTAIE